MERGTEDVSNASPLEGRGPRGVEPRDSGSRARDRGMAPNIYRERFDGAEAPRWRSAGARADPNASEAGGDDDEAGVSRGAARKADLDGSTERAVGSGCGAVLHA